jgi:cytosine/adenosine deaminase-related metal-dependent hydrolase
VLNPTFLAFHSTSLFSTVDDTMTSSIVAYRADWLFPACAEPIRDAVLEVDAAGQILSIRSGRDRDAIDLGRVAIVPSLVNPHVHLEFSDLATPIGPPQQFTNWIRNILAHRRARVELVEDIIRRGTREAHRTGTVAAGEIATVPTECYRFDGLELTLFREFIGPLRQNWPALIEQAEAHLHPQSREGAANFRGGISPHAPHTVPRALFEQLIGVAVKHEAPVAVHLAETAEEMEMLRSGAGDLVEMMRSLGFWEADSHPRGQRPLDWLRELARVPCGLVIHGNYLDDEELDFIAAHPSLTLVYCPRTHAYFGHPPHPFLKLLERGGRVALGTDGRSSNPDLDLWREAQFLSQQHPDLGSVTIMDLITKAGAEALGVAERHGVLTAGRQANFLAVPLAGDADGDRIPDLFALPRPRLRVFVHGIELDHCSGR